MSTVDFERLGNDDKAKITDRVWWEELGHSPDNEIIQDRHWFQVITRSSRAILANSVAKCELDDGNIDKRIQETIATYRSLGAPFHWVVAPSSRPRDLATRLVAAGMHLGGTSYGLIADPRKITSSKHPDVTVEPVTGKNVHEYTSLISSDPFIEDHAVERHRKIVHHHLEKKGHLVSHFLAKFQGKPAGIAQIRYHSDHAFIPGGKPEVKPEFAGHGVFSALVEHLAADAVQKRLHVIANYAGKETAPLWLKRGFEKTCEYGLYFWRPN
jgi:GNAT superfamily N-acetyltransferase